MKVTKAAGGLLIILAILVAFSLCDFLLLAAFTPSAIGIYFGYAWPCILMLFAGIMLWRYKPKGSA
jgi:hypothetical protein